MKRSKNSAALWWALGLLILALAAVGAVVVLKQREYAQGDSFYQSLRSAMGVWL